MRPVNRLILSIDEESSLIQTGSGLILHGDTFYKPETSQPVNGLWNEDVPPFLFFTESKRQYSRNGKIGMYRYNDFPNPLQKGDRVWFSYQANRGEQWMWEDKNYWIAFDDLLFYERDGQGPHAMPGIVVVKPIRIEKSFLEYKTSELEYVEGKRSPDLLRGEVVSVGEPLRGQSSPIYAPGDVIVFQSRWVDTSMRYRSEVVWGVDMEEVLVVLPERAEGSQTAL